MNYLEKADKKIVCVGKNNVEVRFVLYDRDTKEVVLKIESYGQNRIDREKTAAQKEYDKWNKLSQKDIETNKTKAQATLDELADIQTAMDSKK